MSAKTGQTRDPSINWTKSSQTTGGAGHKGPLENTLRRSTRLQSLPVPIYTSELLATVGSKEIMPSSPALPSDDLVPGGAISSSNNDSALVAINDSDEILGHHSFKEAQPSSTSPALTTNNVLSEPEVRASSKYSETDTKITNEPDAEPNNNKGNLSSEEPSVSGQGHLDSALTNSKKRKTVTSGGKKTTRLAPALPPKKKQKLGNPTPKRQRKAGNPKPKTAKERFLAASAEDTRPLPWGEPEVWAEV